MNSALDNDKRLIFAEVARREVAYFCPACKHPVFLKNGMEKTPHFAHHDGELSCPEYHDGMMGKARYMPTLNSLKEQLSKKEYIDRWNSIVRALLDHHWLEECWGSFEIIFPISRFAKTQTLESGDSQRILKFLGGFLVDDLKKYNCDFENLRGLLLPNKLKKLNINTCTYPQFVAYFEKYNGDDKYMLVLELLKNRKSGNCFQNSNKLQHVIFSPAFSKGKYYSIPFRQIEDIEDIKLFFNYWPKEKAEELLRTNLLSKDQKNKLNGRGKV